MESILTWVALLSLAFDPALARNARNPHSKHRSAARLVLLLLVVFQLAALAVPAAVFVANAQPAWRFLR